MAKDLRGIFEEEGAHLKFDRVLAKKIEQYGISFVCKTKDHMEFFGGHLTGVQIIRFTPADSDKWFEILELNDLTIEEKLLDLPSINDKWNVAKNAFNETCIWLMHKFMTSEHLNEHERHDAAVNVSLVLHYRFITGLLVHYFKYPTDKETAEAVYARLSNKFLLKQYGSWSALLRARSEDIVGEHSIHHRTLMEYNSDKSIIDALNDIQGRLRDVWKNLYEVLVQTRHSGTKMTTISSMVELDGESILKDKTKNLSAYNRYLHSIITDRDSFIKEELLEVVCNLMHTMPKPYLVATLEWCSSNYSHGGNKEVDDLINLTLVHQTIELYLNTILT